MNPSILVSIIIILVVLLIIILIYHKKFNKYREDMDEWLLSSDNIKDCREEIDRVKNRIDSLENELKNMKINETEKVNINNLLEDENKLKVIQ